MIAERERETGPASGEVDSEGAEHSVEVTAWLAGRPSLTRAFVDDYRPRHRADLAAD